MKYINLTQGYRAVVDDDMFEYLNQWKWCYARGWAMRRIYTGTGRSNNTGYNVYMHNLVIKPSEGKMIDHINGYGLDNRKGNLRECTLKENVRNRKRDKDNKSGYKGVSWVEISKKWRARITYEGKQIQLGYYEDKRDAAQAYNKAALKYYGEFARLN